MKAIIIQDSDFRALLDQLELAAMRGVGHLRDDPSKPPSTSDIHRAFHYIVVRWAQEHGAIVTPR